MCITKQQEEGAEQASSKHHNGEREQGNCWETRKQPDRSLADLVRFMRKALVRCQSEVSQDRKSRSSVDAVSRRKWDGCP